MYRVLAERGLVRERRRGGHARQASTERPAWRPTARTSVGRGTSPSSPARPVACATSCTRSSTSSPPGRRLDDRRTESEKVARRLINETCRREGVDRDQLTIHADRGGPMIAGTVAELLNDLGVNKSHSRPRVSNDNPFIEAHFKTLKYRPDYPGPVRLDRRRPSLVPPLLPLVQRGPLPLRHRLPPSRRLARRQPHRHRRPPPGRPRRRPGCSPRAVHRPTHAGEHPSQGLDQPPIHPNVTETGNQLLTGSVAGGLGTRRKPGRRRYGGDPLVGPRQLTTRCARGPGSRR